MKQPFNCRVIHCPVKNVCKLFTQWWVGRKFMSHCTNQKRFERNGES